MDSQFDSLYEQYRQLKLQSPCVRHIEEYMLLSSVPSCLADKDVLDSGCGFGYYTRQLAERHPKSLVASDISSEAVQLAKGSCGRLWPDIQFRVQDVAEVTDEQSYDIILCNFVLPYAADVQHLQRMCNRLYAALKPGGYVLGFVPNADRSVDFSEEAVGRQFGGFLEMPANVKDGDDVYAIFLLNQQEIRISMRWFERSTYSRCLLNAGFDASRGAGSVEFLRPEVSPAGVQEFGREFWNSIVLPPVFWLLRATKAAGADS